jgi:7,8-dihydroneopterin aldolase/epimerase/oxygenase
VTAPDAIELRGLRALGHCGVSIEERDRPQPIEVDVDVRVDLGPPGRSDDLADTVDYARLCSDVERVVTSERFALLERLAARVAEVALGDERVSAVTVTVRKLHPPVPQRLTSSGVRLTRTR